MMALDRLPMSTEYSSGLILKILNGIQAGVDVALFDGDYVLGTGDDVDIQIYDVMLSPHHARLLVRDGKVSIAPLSGSLHMRSGFTLEPGDAERPLYPLDVVTIGTTHFAVAPASADWASLGTIEPEPVPAKPSFFDQPVSRVALWHERRATFIAAVTGLLLLGFWVFPYAMMLLTTWPGNSGSHDQQGVIEALSEFDFSERLQVTTAKDGFVQVRGLLDRPEDRDAVIAAINDTGIPVRTHIMTLDVLREHLTMLIKENAPGVTFTLTPHTGITLQGVLADEAHARDLVQLVKESVENTVPVHSEITTRAGLLQAVAELAGKAQIAPFVTFELVDDVIEAEGALSIDMLDPWAGFLQAYASRYAAAVPLRSYVQLRNPDGSALPVAPGMALYLGKADRGARNIDVQRLHDGTYTAADLLIGGDAAVPAGGSSDVAAAQDQTARAPSFSPVAPITRRVDLVKLLDGSVDGGAHGTGLNDLAVRAILLWESGKLTSLKGGPALSDAIDVINKPGIFPGATPLQYKTVLAQMPRTPTRACWSGARLSMQNVVGAAFWLDLFSKSDTITLADLDSAYTALLLEAAFNPLQTAKCLQMASDGLNSHYLESVSREPHTIRTLLSAVPSYPAQITGVSLPGSRYFQLHDGRIFREGDEFGANTSVLAIGEMGVLFASGDSIAATITSVNALAWKTN
jgi:hypothetical protein